MTPELLQLIAASGGCESRRGRIGAGVVPARFLWDGWKQDPVEQDPVAESLRFWIVWGRLRGGTGDRRRQLRRRATGAAGAAAAIAYGHTRALAGRKSSAGHPPAYAVWRASKTSNPKIDALQKEIAT